MPEIVVMRGDDGSKWRLTIKKADTVGGFVKVEVTND